MLKIERARQHALAIAALQQSFIASTSFTRGVEIWPDGRWAHKVRATSHIPAEALTLCSEAIGGLRSSLDLAVCESVTRQGSEAAKDTYFVFASSRIVWEKSVTKKASAASPKVVEVMRSFEPWGGGNDVLYTLSKLAVLDKHRLVIPITYSVGIPNYMEIDCSGGNIEVLAPTWDHVKNEAAVLLTPGPYGLKRVHINANFGFGPATSIEGKPVVPFLNEAAAMVENVIKAIAAVS